MTNTILTSTIIRPFTNKDYTNTYSTKFGLPRPMKHYRKGISHVENATSIANRSIKSSQGTNLLSLTPNSHIVRGTSTGTSASAKDDACIHCVGIQSFNNDKKEPFCCKVPAQAIKRTQSANTLLPKSYFQSSSSYLFNRCQTFQQRQFNFVVGPIDEQVLNLMLQSPFVTAQMIEYSKPGDPLSIANYYVAQCSPNYIINTSVELGFIQSLSSSLLQLGLITEQEYETISTSKNIQSFMASLKTMLTTEQYDNVVNYLYSIAKNGMLTTLNKQGCARVIYKPNNPQFAQQGAVSNSTRILKLTVDTIRRDDYLQKKNVNSFITLLPSIQSGLSTNVPFLYKYKFNQCSTGTCKK